MPQAKSQQPRASIRHVKARLRTDAQLAALTTPEALQGRVAVVTEDWKKNTQPKYRKALDAKETTRN